MSVLADYLDRQGRVSWAPCKNLKKIVVGEKLMVNWHPAGETRLATVVSSVQRGWLVRLDHDSALIEIQSREQVSWDEKKHSKTS